MGGKVLRARKIRGKLHCVRPIALRTVPVFAQNSREYEVIAAGKFGIVVQMEIGALLVGKINNFREKTDKSRVWAGDEKGYFAFGGSTIVVMLQKGNVVLNEALYGRQTAGRTNRFIITVSMSGQTAWNPWNRFRKQSVTWDLKQTAIPSG